MVIRKLLLLGRHLMVIPVIGSLLLTVGVVGMGAALIFERAWNLFRNGDLSPKAAKLMSVTVIETIDFFLVGALAYITAIGIYNLFISSSDEPLLKRIKIERLSDLEDKIIGVVVAALAVAFLGSASKSEQMLEVLYAGTGTSLVIGALCLFLYFPKK
ncbi:MAG: YqhA family protein [Pirellulaceae bacterium]